MPDSRRLEPSDITRLTLAGWSGRDQAAVDAHIRELAALGVPGPTTTPVFYSVSASLLTTAADIQVVGGATSGEVEFLLARFADGRWVGLASDQTDRAFERTSIALAKQLCAKVAAPTLWRYDDVAPHWDRLMLRAWAHRAGKRELYQEAALSAVLPADTLLDRYREVVGAFDPGCALLGGTVPVVHEIAPA